MKRNIFISFAVLFYLIIYVSETHNNNFSDLIVGIILTFPVILFIFFMLFMLRIFLDILQESLNTKNSNKYFVHSLLVSIPAVIVITFLYHYYTGERNTRDILDSFINISYDYPPKDLFVKLSLCWGISIIFSAYFFDLYTQKVNVPTNHLFDFIKRNSPLILLTKALLFIPSLLFIGQAADCFTSPILLSGLIPLFILFGKKENYIFLLLIFLITSLLFDFLFLLISNMIHT